MGHPRDRERLTALASAELTYPEAGATRGALPVGYHHDYREVPLGAGRATFDRAAEALLSWDMHRATGFTVTATGPAATGATVVLRARAGPVSIVAPCRVVYLVDAEDRCGFAYGTLPGHPERGEEAFVVRMAADGEVTFVVRAFSRPAWWLARAGAPFARRVQAMIADRYVGAMRRLIGH